MGEPNVREDVDLLRHVSSQMREDHGPDHPRHRMWVAIGDWLFAASLRLEFRGDHNHEAEQAVAVAHAYLDAARALASPGDHTPEAGR